MAAVRPLRGIRYDLRRVDLGACLAPPYDVISDAQREELYARDPHNVVRIDYGRGESGDVDGADDRYTRAAAHLRSWLDEGVLRQDPRPALYVYDQVFAAVEGGSLTRRGVLARVRALPWEQSDVIPHEHTLRGPKEDRLRLMRATRAQTSAVYLLWDRAPGMAAALTAATGGAPDAQAGAAGEMGAEEHRLWVVDDEVAVVAITEALASARLYMADGHHRFETAAAHAAERRAADPGTGADADSQWTLALLCAADDPAVEVLPTHRLVRPAPGIPASLDALLARLDGRFSVERRPSLTEAMAAAEGLRARDGRHALAVGAGDGAVLLHRPRTDSPSPRARLDVTVAEAEILLGACGLDAERIGGGALAYTRTVAEAETAVAAGRAALAVCVNPVSTREMIDVSDAGEQMPQKSTYFYPKVPTGLVLSPL